mmetsp:Transcript_32741/g.54082  ORF Transcript_32741/g.54082 Transcript_32741/m.54082 type:complete len:466 (+) Transcript_32741:116-1513(+)
MRRHRRHITDQHFLKEEPARRKAKWHSSTWIVIFVSAILASGFSTLYLPNVSSSADWFELQASASSFNDLLLIEVPFSSGHLIFLENEPFPAVRGRRVPVYPSDSTDDNTEEEMRSECDSNKQVHPTCNDFHSMEFSELLLKNQASILSDKGSWRTAWEYHEQTSFSSNTNRTITTTTTTTTSSPTMVLKTLRREHNYKDAYYEFQEIDAIVMEQFTSSPYIIDMYSYCGMSVLTDFAETTVSRVLDKTIRPIEKLKLIKQVTKGIADMHRGGVIHNDVNQANLAYSIRKQVPVFFDFNIAVFRDDDDSSSCPFVAKFPNPQWRAPEELQIGNRLTEKVDIYALGNILFRFVAGDPPWGRHRKSVSEEQFIFQSKQQGKLPPYITPVDENDTATSAMIHVMTQCYAFEPQNRPSATRVITVLNAAIHNHSSNHPVKSKLSSRDDRQSKRTLARGRKGTKKGVLKT